MKQILLLLLAAAPGVWAGRIVGDVTQLVSLDFVGNPGTITWAAVAPGTSNLTGTGSPVGPNFAQAVLFGSGTDYGQLGPSMYGVAGIDLTAGPGTSFQNTIAEGISGVLRVTNSSASSAVVQFQSGQYYDLHTYGPDSAALDFAAAVEFFNPQTQMWDVRFSTAATLLTDTSNTFCNPACTGTNGFTLAANSSVDIRARAYLQGRVSQTGASALAEPEGAPVPEPSTAGLVAAAMGWLAWRRARRRGHAALLGPVALFAS